MKNPVWEPDSLLAEHGQPSYATVWRVAIPRTIQEEALIMRQDSRSASDLILFDNHRAGTGEGDDPLAVLFANRDRQSDLLIGEGIVEINVGL